MRPPFFRLSLLNADDFLLLAQFLSHLTLSDSYIDTQLQLEADAREALPYVCRTSFCAWSV